MRTAGSVMSGTVGEHVATDSRVTGLDGEGITVLVVEDHALLAQTLVIALRAEGCSARVADLFGP